MIRAAGIWNKGLAAGLMMGILASGCAPPDADIDTSRPTDFGFQQSAYEAKLERGKAAYDLYCVGCHGVNGDGNGEAAKFLHSKPRNFQLANFKFSSTRSGQLPLDENLKRSIRNGLKGSAMPDWRLLPEPTIDALIAYIKTFSEKWPQRGPGRPVPFVEDPYRGAADKSAAIRRGEVVYHGFATCWTCHPAYVPESRINEHLVEMENPPRDGFRPGLQHAEGKANTEGEIIYPPDFLRDFVRAGVSVEDLYRSIAAGITGTAMPTWIDSMDVPSAHGQNRKLVTPADIWAMAYYVQSLIARRPARLDPEQIEIRERPQWISLTGEPAPQPESPTSEFETEQEFIEDE